MSKTKFHLLIFTLLLNSMVIAQSSKDRIIEYKSNNDSIYCLLIMDFESDFSLYIDYYAPNVKQSEGSFDLTTYNTQKTYSDTIFLYQSPFDGTTWSKTHVFHAMKKGSWKYYYSNGKLQCFGNYDQNLKEGEWNYFGDDGELQIVRIYHKGNIMIEKIVAKGSYLYPEK